jgi:hypothetical protein
MSFLKLQVIYGIFSLLGLILLPYPSPGQIGAYNSYSRLYVCVDRETCVHEQGHKLDQELAYPSQSFEFERAVTKFIVKEFSNSPSDYAIHLMNIILTRNSQKETYANIWMWADGDIENVPVEFQEFYK